MVCFSRCALTMASPFFLNFVGLRAMCWLNGMGKGWRAACLVAGLQALILLGCVLGVSSQACLKEFKASITDPQKNLAPLSESPVVCNWTGVQCRHPSASDVSQLDLSELGLEGELRLDLLKACDGLSTIKLSGNSFSGSIPDDLATAFPNLVSLDLSRNNIRGEIPADIVMCQYLNSLALDSNQLVGTIPPELGQLPRLGSLNVSYNRLEGIIPATLLNRSQFLDGTPRSFPEDSFIGNAGLTVPSAFCKSFSRIACENRRKSFRIWLVAALVASALVLFSVAVLVCMVLWKRGPGKPAKLSGSESAKLIPFTAVPPMENRGTEPVRILSKRLGSRRGLIVEDLWTATAYLSKELEIGYGPFSKVYKAELPDGKVVAIKWLNLENKGDPEMILPRFSKAVEAVGHFRHPNLVRTLGYVAKVDMMLLILDYMPQGSLEMLLYGSPALQVNDCQLSWDERYGIALGVAMGLKYLHQESPRPLVHSDLNPSNILLDADLVAHVSPLGVAKLVSECAGSNASYWTIGYTAPENVFSMTSSPKADVYSFGILLLELITRQRPTSSLFGDGVTMSQWVNDALVKQNLLRILDPTLARSGNFTDAQLREISMVCRLGLSCSQEAPSARPDMKAVVRMLQQRGKNRDKISSKVAAVEEIVEVLEG